MKKITAIIVLAAGLFTGSLHAQTKTGYIKVDDMVGLMPELKKIDTLLNIFQNDSLPRTYNYLLAQYQRYDSIANDSTHSPVVVRQDAAKQRGGFLEELQNWQTSAQQMFEAKQSSLLQPLYAKVMNAINEVAKEKGYSYIYSREALLVAPPADDILPFVAEKLKVKVPPPGAGTKPTVPKTN
jgi:outer membrane protein